MFPMKPGRAKSLDPDHPDTDRLEARRQGAHAKDTGRPLYSNPHIGLAARQWTIGWLKGVSPGTGAMRVTAAGVGVYAEKPEEPVYRRNGKGAAGDVG